MARARVTLGNARTGARFSGRPSCCAACCSWRSLLNRNGSLHVHREVRRAMELVLAGLDAGERDRYLVADVQEQRARELTELVRAHVCVELTLRVGRNDCRIERDVVRRDRDDGELDSVAGFDREVGGFELIGVAIADHLHFPRLSGDGERCAGRGRSRCCRRCCRRRSCRSRILGTATARADNKGGREKRYTLEPHRKASRIYHNEWLTSEQFRRVLRLTRSRTM